MFNFVVDKAQARAPIFVRRYAPGLRRASAALLVAVAYYVGAQVGLALTFQPHPVSTLWPPNSILLAALLLSRVRLWPVLLLASFPAHLLVQLNADIPLTMILCWFVSNCSEALMGALILWFLIRSEIRFDNTYHVGMFIVAAIAASLLSSFLDAGLVELNQFGNSPYWSVFRMRFFSNVLASLTLVPLILTWWRGGIPSLKNSWKRVEGALLATGVLIVAGVTLNAGTHPTPALLYLPLPLLLWAAIGFGPRGSSAVFLIVSFLEIWDAIRGHGPFATQSAEINALSVQIFLILALLPLLVLAALIKEREQAQQAAVQKEERLELALNAAQQASQALSDNQKELRQSHSHVRKLLGKLINVQEAERRRISRELHDDLNQKIATLSMNVSQLKRKLPVPESELVAELDQLREIAMDLTDDVRTLSHQLHPALLEHLGLVSALESYITHFEKEEKINVKLTADIGTERIPFQLSICLYRVAVEALRNVARHSGASSAAISLRRLDDVLELLVSDSGKGFNVATFRQGGGLGLVSVEERLGLLQGTCEIHSAPDCGTTMVARVPLER
jgi:two-component system sensor histidine kinase UhpB